MAAGKRKKKPSPVTEEMKHFSLFSTYDIELYKAGRHFQLYNHLGSHCTTVDGVEGVYFAVWAPNAKYVSLVGNFNAWNRYTDPLFVRWDSSGIWELFLPGMKPLEYYKYFIEG